VREQLERLKTARLKTAEARACTDEVIAVARDTRNRRGRDGKRNTPNNDEAASAVDATKDGLDTAVAASPRTTRPPTASPGDSGNAFSGSKRSRVSIRHTRALTSATTAAGVRNDEVDDEHQNDADDETADGYEVEAFSVNVKSIPSLRALLLKLGNEFANDFSKGCDAVHTKNTLERQQLTTARQRAKIHELEAERNCGICLSAPKSVALGCGHMLCGSCSDAVETCPMDRKRIVARIPLFF
jgi:hypothetical protein